jgi:hypothetical protein
MHRLQGQLQNESRWVSDIEIANQAFALISEIEHRLKHWELDVERELLGALVQSFESTELTKIKEAAYQVVGWWNFDLKSWASGGWKFDGVHRYLTSQEKLTRAQMDLIRGLQRLLVRHTDKGAALQALRVAAVQALSEVNS